MRRWTPLELLLVVVAGRIAQVVDRDRAPGQERLQGGGLGPAEEDLAAPGERDDQLARQSHRAGTGDQDVADASHPVEVDPMATDAEEIHPQQPPHRTESSGRRLPTVV